MTGNNQTFDGGCTCGHVRYRLTSRPMFVNACHCTWCQRETGGAFATNALIEADRVELTGAGAPEAVDTPSASGKGQKTSRCPKCRIAVWSNYSGAGDAIRFVRVGSLDAGHDIAPDAHIFTSTKRPWVVLPPGVPVAVEFYNAKKVWPKESLDRRAAAMQRK